MEIPTGFGAICALYPVLARVQADGIQMRSRPCADPIQNVETTIIHLYLEVLGRP